MRYVSGGSQIWKMRYRIQLGRGASNLNSDDTLLY